MKNKVFDVKKIINYPLTICFFTFIFLIFVLYYALGDREISEWENRYLSGRPEIRFNDLKDGSYMEKYEEYVNDQIPFRDGFIKLKSVSETILLKIENNGIARGEDSYLFTKGTEDTSQFDKNIEIISKFCDSIENPVIVAIAPNAAGVISEKVPKGLLMPDQCKKLDELKADNSLLKGARVVDLKCALKAHEDEYIYYHTDHHWTTTGAYYAYCEISENPVDIDRITRDSETFVYDDFLGTLYAKYKGFLVRADSISYYDIPVKSYKTDDTVRDGLLDKDKLSVFDKYRMFMYGNFGKCDLETYSENGRQLIVFKDSYANCLIPFLTYDYEHITVIDLRFFGESVQELIQNNQKADVMFIHNFDFLNEDNHLYKLMK